MTYRLLHTTSTGTAARPRGYRLPSSLAGLVCTVLLAVSVSGCGMLRSREAAIHDGDAHLGAKRYVEAIESYREALEGSPRDVQTRVKLRDAYIGAQRWSDATAEAVRVADLLPSDRSAQKMAVSLLVSARRFQDAIDRAAGLLEADSNDAPLLIDYGNAKAALPNSWSVLAGADVALRDGRDYRVSTIDMRPASHLPEHDDEAEQAFLKARAFLGTNTVPADQALASLYILTDRLDEAEPYLKSLSKQDPLAHRLLGLLVAYRERPTEAESYLRAAAGGGDPASIEALGAFLLARRRYQDALDTLEPLRLKGPSTSVELQIARAQIGAGDAMASARTADGVLSREPANAAALAIKSQSLALQGHTEHALAAATDALKQDAGAVVPQLVATRALLDLGRRDEALDAFTQLTRVAATNVTAKRELAALAFDLRQYDRALTYARDAVRAFPDDDYAARYLARALVRSGDLVAAEQVLRPLQAKYPGSRGLEIIAGDILAARGNYAEARKRYARALDSEEEGLEALTHLVEMEIAQKQFAAAREHVKNSGGAHDVDHLLLAARVAEAAGDTATLEDAYRKVLALDPTNDRASLKLAQIQLDQRRHAEARALVEGLLKARPSFVEALVMLGRTLEATGDTAAARSTYEKALDRDPDAGYAALRLAVIHLEEGKNLEQALTYASTAKQKLPEDPAVNDTLGWIYVRMGLAGRGVPLLEDAVRRAPGNALYHYHAGMSYIDSGQLLKARAELERAISIDKSFSGADRARAALGWLPR